MALKQVFAPHLNRSVKLGLLPRRPGLVHLHFSDFVTHSKLPPIPPTFSYQAKAAVPLADIYGNDNLGDCAIAMMFHAAAVFTGNATGVPYHAALSQVVAAYTKVGGYIPGRPETDNGCVLTDVFKYWQTTGLPNGEKIRGFISINAASPSDIMASGFLLENHCFGVGLPDPYITPFPTGPGFVWRHTGQSDPNNGHAFLGLGGATSGKDAGIDIDTWGLSGRFTFDAIAAYAGSSGGGEMWSVITDDMIAKGAAKAPNGFAWGDLVAAFDALGGNLPIPVPPAPPAPVLAPTATMTLGECQLSAIDLLHNTGGAIMLKGTAEKLVVDSIAKHWPRLP